MPRWAVVILSVVAGLAVIVGLGVVFVGEADQSTGAGPAVETTAPTTTAETTTASPSPPETPTLLVRVQDGSPVGGIQRLTVAQGDLVRVRVVSDLSDHVHVHGYDLMRDVAAGAPATIRFRATLAGRFEIELEDRGTLVAELEVRP